MNKIKTFIGGALTGLLVYFSLDKILPPKPDVITPRGEWSKTETLFTSIGQEAIDILKQEESGADGADSINGVYINGQSARSVISRMLWEQYPNRRLSELTIHQVNTLQYEYLREYNKGRKTGQPYASSALGLGQFTSTTLEAYAKHAGLLPDDVFSEANQILIIEAILRKKRPKVIEWLRSESAVIPADVMVSLGKEWQAFQQNPDVGREFLWALKYNGFK